MRARRRARRRKAEAQAAADAALFAPAAELLNKVRQRRRDQGELVCLACGGSSGSGLRSRCPPCTLTRQRAQVRIREARRNRDRAWEKERARLTGDADLF